MWNLTDHVCHRCFGRLLIRQTAGGTLVRCANCGAERIGSPTDLCCCGLKVRNQDAGLRCQRNPRPSPEQPAELAVGYVGR